jgi:hypothetical protein
MSQICWEMAVTCGMAAALFTRVSPGAGAAIYHTCSANVSTDFGLEGIDFI